MAQKRRVSPWLRGTLYVIAVLFLPLFLIQTFRPDVLDPKSPRPTLQTFRFDFIVKTGSLYERLAWHELAIAKFQEGEQFASQMTDAQYPSLLQARERLAEAELAVGRTSDADRVYTRIIDAAMQAGDASLVKTQWSEAASEYRDAERFAKKLSANKSAPLLKARQSLATCLNALNQNQELATLDQDMIDAMQESGDTDGLALGNAYQSLAFARSRTQDWAEAEQALLHAMDSYDSVLQFPSGQSDIQNRVAQAQQMKNIVTWYLAVVYLNEGKTGAALSTADAAFQIFSAQPVETGITMQIISVGVKAATAAKDQDQIELWQKRLSDATGGQSQFVSPMAVQIPRH
jgi:hypothetical protein